eukprot:scaffold1803_cov92-Amphora_coffeaeformis.AAC.56
MMNAAENVSPYRKMTRNASEGLTVAWKCLGATKAVGLGCISPLRANRKVCKEDFLVQAAKHTA